MKYNIIFLFLIQFATNIYVTNCNKHSYDDSSNKYLACGTRLINSKIFGCCGQALVYEKEKQFCSYSTTSYGIHDFDKFTSVIKNEEEEYSDIQENNNDEKKIIIMDQNKNCFDSKKCFMSEKLKKHPEMYGCHCGMEYEYQKQYRCGNETAYFAKEGCCDGKIFQYSSESCCFDPLNDQQFVKKNGNACSVKPTKEHLLQLFKYYKTF